MLLRPRSGEVIEFELKPPSEEDTAKIMYVFGLNLANLLPPDIKSLLSKDELEIALKGMADMALERAEDPMEQLSKYGDQVNALLQTRTQDLMERAMEAGREFLKKAAEEEGAEKTAGGAVVLTVEKGVGPYPSAASSVEVHYSGQLIDGTVFDSSRGRPDPVNFPMKQVIPGMQEGLQAMQEGSKARLVIPPELGYGTQGKSPLGTAVMPTPLRSNATLLAGIPDRNIPGGATLIFDIELVKVSDCASWALLV